MVKIINIDTKTKTIHISNADGDIKTWRTTESGAHFPIREGESTKEALDKFVGSKRLETKKGQQPADTPQPGITWNLTEKQKKEFKDAYEKQDKARTKEDEEIDDLCYNYGVDDEKDLMKAIEDHYVNQVAFYGKDSRDAEQAMRDYRKAAEYLHQEPKSHDEMMQGRTLEIEPDINPETEFQEAFMKTKWTAGNGYATYTDGNWRFEISRDGDEYISAVTSADDFDRSGVEEEESFSTLADARKHAEQMIEEYAGDTEEEREAKVPKVRNIVRGSFRFEKVGKVFRLTGYYSGDSVDLDFEKLTGHRPGSSVRYEADGNKITISDYYGAWEKEIDFDELSDEEIAEMIIK